MKCTASVLFASLSLFAAAHAADIGVNPTSWPGTSMSGALQTPSILKFRGNIQSFQHPNGEYYLSFEADVINSTTAYVDDNTQTFVASMNDKGTAAAIFTAFSTGANFRVVYAKDTSFWNRRVMFVKVFMLEKT
jgi:hypothetical protein